MIPVIQLRNKPRKMRPLSKILSATALLITAACNKPDDPPATLINNYRSQRSEEITPVRIYTSAGPVTDAAAINSYLSAHPQQFTAAPDSAGSGIQSLRMMNGGSITLSYANYAANYNSTAVEMRMTDTMTVIQTTPGLASAARARADSLFFRLSGSVVNLYGSYSHSYLPSPGSIDSIINKYSLHLNARFSGDTFYIPETRVFFKGTLGTVPYYGATYYFNPLYPAPVNMPALNPGDTLAVQQGLRKFHRI